MSAALHRSSPRELVERFVVWLLGFAVTGVVFHDVTAAQLVQLRVRDWLFVVGSVVTVLAGVSYFAFVMPRSIAGGFAAITGYSLALALVLIGTQWLGVQVIEARQ